MGIEEFANEIVCVRLTDNLPRKKVKSARHLYRRECNYGLFKGDDPKMRFTVHFSLNYPYFRYNAGDRGKFRWDNLKYGVLIPLGSLLESGQFPINLHHADTFFMDEVELTEDSKVLKQPNLIGKVKREIEKMGFELKEGSIAGWKPVTYAKDRAKLSELAERIGATNYYHYKTLFGKFEKSMRVIDRWDSLRNRWEFDVDEIGLKYLRNETRKLVRIFPKLPNQMKRYSLKKLGEVLEYEAGFIRDILEKNPIRNCFPSSIRQKYFRK